MNAEQPSPEQDGVETLCLELQLANARVKETWILTLDCDLLSLANPDERTVLTLPKEEAARYVRFAYDVFRGRTVTFVIIEGLKSYSFLCPKDQTKKLIGWMPLGAPAQLIREIRYSGVAVALFGVVHVLAHSSLFWGWGALLLSAGALGIVVPQRAMYLLNGLLMIATGLADLVLTTPDGIDPRVLPPQYRVLPIVMGSALILWGVQQLSMLGTNHRLRTARALRDEEVAFTPGASPIVRGIGLVNAAGAIVFGAYALAVLVMAGPIIAGTHSVLPDLAVFGLTAIVASASAAMLLARKRPPYLQAKVSVQMLLTVVVFAVFGIALHFRTTAPGPLLGSLLSTQPTVFINVWAWVCLTVCVLAFNRWYAHAIDRELEEQRD